MKKYLTLALALVTALSFAQPYNNTYDINGNNDPVWPSFNIVNNLQESITVSNGTNGNSNYFILTKIGVAGNPIYCWLNRAPLDPMEGYLHVEALHETINGEVIVGGYYYSNQSAMVLQPFLARFNAAGNLVWHKIYPVNQRLIVNADINKVSLCRVYTDLPVENYFFVVAGDSDANPGTEVATNVLKIDGATGNLIFSNKYYPVNPLFNLREYPGDIEYSVTKQMYMITGHREYTDADGNVNYQMYHFGIFGNGAMFGSFLPPNNYLTITTKSRPIDQDMVYEADLAADQFATVYTHDMQGYVAGIQSIMGFIKVNPALMTANPVNIWHNNGDRHNGRSISNRAPGGFVLCAGIHENVNPPFVNNPALQMVDNAGIPNSQFMRYNILDDVYFSHHAWNPIRDEFVLASEHNTALPEELRVISTTPAGNACGMREYPYKYEPYSPEEKLHEYYPRTHNVCRHYDLHQQWIDTLYRKCMPPGNSYRTTGLSSFTADNLNVRVYPSVMSRNNAELTIENNSGAELRVEVRSITGQLIQASESVGTDKTTVKLNQDLAAGVYMVHFYSADGNVSATEKILISE